MLSGSSTKRRPLGMRSSYMNIWVAVHSELVTQRHRSSVFRLTAQYLVIKSPSWVTFVCTIPMLLLPTRAIQLHRFTDPFRHRAHSKRSFSTATVA